jgi:hypothetical protein
MYQLLTILLLNGIMMIFKLLKNIVYSVQLGLLMGVILLSYQTLSAQETEISTQISNVRQSATQWLSKQMVPNATVPLPAQYRRRLILSYQIPPNDSVYPYLSSRSFIYDNALAIIAFTIVKDFKRAEYILGALNRLLSEEGSLWFAYNTHNSWPSKQDNYGALKRLGAIAWVGYAAVYYLGKQLKQNPGFLDEDILAKDYLGFSEKIANFAISKQILDNSDKRYGLITGGDATYFLKPTPEGSGIQEKYKGEAINWVSMEHNIDTYFFLRDLGRITKNTKYIEKADLIKKGLLTLWSQENGQLYRGISLKQEIDRFLPLDGASWGALFFLAIGEDEKALLSLNATNNFFNRSKGLEGYGPYFKEMIYEDRDVNQFYYPENPGKTWKELKMIWGEGSLGVAVAYIRAGHLEKGLEIINNMMLMQKKGGFKYASINIPYLFNNFPSVASTAWFIIASEIYLNQENLFWGK